MYFVFGVPSSSRARPGNEKTKQQQEKKQERRRKKRRRRKKKKHGHVNSSTQRETQILATSAPPPRSFTVMQSTRWTGWNLFASLARACGWQSRVHLCSWALQRQSAGSLAQQHPPPRPPPAVAAVARGVGFGLRLLLLTIPVPQWRHSCRAGALWRAHV